MAKTVLSPVSTYLQPSSRKRLDRIVEATRHRMTLSKLLDEGTEIVLPILEQKYLGSVGPTRDGHSRSKVPA